MDLSQRLLLVMRVEFEAEVTRGSVSLSKSGGEVRCVGRMDEAK